MKYSIPLTALILVLGAYFVWGTSNAPFPAKFGTANIPINSPLTQGGVLCGNNTSTLLMATSTSGRNFATISNDSGNAIFIGFGNSATSNKGLLLNASTTFTLNSNASYTGAIYCAGLGATATATYSDSNS